MPNPMLRQYNFAALDLYSWNLENSVQHCNQYTSLAVSLLHFYSAWNPGLGI